MKDGKLDPNTALPKFFEILEAKAAGGWDSYVQTTRYQQNKAGVGFENSLELFRTSGGNDAFFKGWKGIADSLPKMDGLVKGMARAFGVLADGVVRVSDILVLFSTGIEKFNGLAPDTQSAIGTLGLAWVLFGTRVGRAMLPLTALMLLLDDMAVYNQGGKSLIGDAIDGNGGAMGKLALLAGGGLAASALAGGGGGGNTNTRSSRVGNVLKSTPFLGLAAVGLYEGAGWLGDKGQELTEQNNSKKRTQLDSMQAVMDQSQNMMSPMYGGFGQAIEIANLNINATTNDPDEHAYLFMKAIGDTMPHFHNPEGY